MTVQQLQDRLNDMIDAGRITGATEIFLADHEYENISPVKYIQIEDVHSTGKEQLGIFYQINRYK
jgi:hypothetical protein